MIRGQKILCISPHPDDVEFGAGGTLSKYRNKTGPISLIVLSNRKKTRGEQHNVQDQKKSAEHLGIDYVRFFNLPVRFFGTEECRDQIRLLVTREVESFKPNLLLCPSLVETMQDHKAVAEEVVRVIRSDVSIFGYEVPKHNRHFVPDFFVRLASKDVKSKIDALSLFSEFTNRYYFEEDVIRSLAVIRALHAGFSGFAEAFDTYRLID